ncbi:PKD domain-containing protein, partial [candidate division KSB1 bacterium]|nr:PKD domain-containing protein [candidate division KSB1 bacterium]
MAAGWGIFNANATMMDAELNYWNSAEGPNDPNGTITVNSKVFTVNQDGLTAGSTAMFWDTPTMVWPYGVVQFEDMSNLGATAWQWDFGDGQTSTLQNPLIMYTKPGKYSVTLTITTPT